MQCSECESDLNPALAARGRHLLCGVPAVRPPALLVPVDPPKYKARDWTLF